MFSSSFFSSKLHSLPAQKHNKIGNSDLALGSLFSFIRFCCLVFTTKRDLLNKTLN